MRYIVNRADANHFYVLDTLAKGPAEPEARFKDGSAVGRSYTDASYAQAVADNLNFDYQQTNRHTVHAALRDVRYSRYRRLVLLLRWHHTRNGWAEHADWDIAAKGWYWRRLGRLQHAMDTAVG